MIINQNIRPLIETVALSFAAFLSHKLIFLFFGFSDDSFRYSLIMLYGLFAAASFGIMQLLLVIYIKSINSVGFAFMFLTCGMLVFAYVLLQKILGGNNPDISFEKTNFFIVVLAFLTIETIGAVRLLNRK